MWTRRIYRFCCPAPATEIAASRETVKYTWGPRHTKKNFQPFVIGNTYILHTGKSSNSYSLDLQNFKQRDYCLPIFQAFKVPAKTFKLSAISPQGICINYKCQLKYGTYYRFSKKLEETIHWQTFYLYYTIFACEFKVSFILK